MNLTVQAAGQTTRYTSGEGGYKRENQVFIEALLSGDPSAIESPYEDGVRTQMVACAANESIESGQPARP